MQFFTRINAVAVATVLLFANITPVASRTTNNAVAGRYIVLLKPDTTDSLDAHYNNVRSIHARNLRRNIYNSSTGIGHKYQIGDFLGYAGSFDKYTIKELKALPEVLSVELDSIVKPSSYNLELSSPWGLAQLSSNAIDQSGEWPTERRWYAYDSSAGYGTFTYVIDSGIRLDHNEFGGRAIFGYNAVEHRSSSNEDETGHGTWVAGIIGGTLTGVAKNTTLVSVKAWSTTDSMVQSDILKALDWAVEDIVSKKREKIAVINISCRPGDVPSTDRAITAAFKLGVLVVAVAGNQGEDATEVPLCRSPETICVGAVGPDLRKWSHSNYGSKVDIYAPGVGIPSASFQRKDGYEFGDGTSGAAPHVAGLVSYLRGVEGPSTAAKVKARVYALAKKNVVGDVPHGKKNLLAYNGGGLPDSRHVRWKTNGIAGVFQGGFERVFGTPILFS
ncbi:subtilisin-like protease-like protein [Ampelomyces quisqualis]|uniref:Subtilisin-like protease-like protein n=1 Tax=Ampelomyces quisqualis TaxID=50730 RepID=A0A6A5QJD8_AMPQU|nr:subtilisin-like protease-like protein [Ampelomyces quisqualis]